MLELVRFKPYIWLCRGLAILAGKGLTERIRATGFALLGLTAAGGLALVAIFAQPGWPLLEQAPLPSPPEHAVSRAVALGHEGGASGSAPTGAASVSVSENGPAPGGTGAGGPGGASGGGSPHGAVAVGPPQAAASPGDNAGGDQSGGGSTPSPVPTPAPAPVSMPAPEPTTSNPAPELVSSGSSGRSTAGSSGNEAGDKGGQGGEAGGDENEKPKREEKPKEDVSPPSKPHGSSTHGYGKGPSEKGEPSGGDAKTGQGSTPPVISYEPESSSGPKGGKGNAGARGAGNGGSGKYGK